MEPFFCTSMTRRQAIAATAGATAALSFLGGIRDSAAAAEPKEKFALAEHICTLEMNWLPDRKYDFQSAFGRRSFRSGEGRITGKRLNGKILEFRASDYGRLSKDGRIRSVDAKIAIQTTDGQTVLMTVCGRASPRYQGNSRLLLMFDAGGAYEWLNYIAAVGVGRIENGTEIVDIYRVDPAHVPGDKEIPDGMLPLEGEALFSRQSKHLTGRTVPPNIMSPFGEVLIGVAEGGGDIAGPRLNGTMVVGYSWRAGELGGPNKKLRGLEEVLLADKAGVPVLMASLPTENRTMSVFETPEDGPYAWLNEVVAVGVGRLEQGRPDPKYSSGHKYLLWAL